MILYKKSLNTYFSITSVEKNLSKIHHYGNRRVVCMYQIETVPRALVQT